jgi:uncharacterized protein
MDQLLTVALAGFAASFVDGALGMGFGPTSSTILLSSGVSPAMSATMVNIAKIFTGGAAGISHWRFGNVDRALMIRLAVPGAVGAIAGSTVLSRVNGDTLRPWLALLLMVVGIRILIRFRNPIRPVAATSPTERRAMERSTIVFGGIGGITNGMIGTWGPVVTPYLLHRGLAPRITVGTVNTAEIAVAAVATGSLLSLVSAGSLDFRVLLAMLAGGVIAAPLAAWSVKHLPARTMGIAVAVLLLLTNVRELMNWAGISANRWIAYLMMVVLGVMSAAAPLRQRSRLLGSVS